MKSELPAPANRKRGFWRTCRVYFRRFRITVWLLILALLGALVYLTQVGLPDFAKQPLLDNLRSRGVELQFSRLRLSWQLGIVAENVRFGRADEPLSPELRVGLVQLRLNHRALGRLQIQVDSLLLRQGRLVWALADTNQAPRQLAVENIQTELRFLPGDEWALDHFTAGFAGASIQLSGTVANASAVREWRVLKADQAAPADAWRDRLREFADLMERIRFSAPPTFRLDIRGDARNLASFGVRVLLSAPGADTPWGTVSLGRFSARLYPAATNGLSRAELSLEAEEAHTRWATTGNLQLSAHVSSFESLTNLGNGDLTLCAGRVETEWGRATNLQLTMHGASLAGQTNLISADLALWAGHVETKWGSATNAQFNAQWIHALTNPIPLGGEGKLLCRQPNTEWGTASELQLDVRLAAPPAGAAPRADESWAGWAKLEPYQLDWDGRLRGVQSRGLAVEDLGCSGNWRAPELTITNFHADLDQRHLSGSAGLDVATRALSLTFASDVDPRALEPALPEEAHSVLEDVSWPQPPELKGDVKLVLPAWTNREPDWRAEVQPTIRLQGVVKLEHGGAYRGVEVSALQSHVAYSNLVWRLPDLTILRPEGTLEAVLEADERTGDFYARVSSTLDLRMVRPLLDEEQQQGLDLVTFTNPPVISAEVWGHAHELERTGLKARVALSNFTFRGESASGLQTGVQYTNQFLQFNSPRVQRGVARIGADGVGVDLAAQLVFLTNGFGAIEPMVVARAIGADIAQKVEAYQFKQPPVAHVYGTIPMHGEDAADLHFELDGGPFEWSRFHLPHISGHVHWLGQQLFLNNIQADFYGGQAAGSAQFHFRPGGEADYKFAVFATNALLGPLTRDMFLVTNRLEGWLWGNLVVTNASTASMQTWDGYGDLHLRDGFIWEIPIFGIFSGVLNGMVPGLGNSRASAGTCTFSITNGVIRSEDMDIRSTGMRLQYRGTLDFDGKINARVEAGILRDMPLFGQVFSTVLWPVTKLFEYKVTGTLGAPKADPVSLVPKVMFLPFQLPFHPLRTLRGLLPEDLGSSPTNAPTLTSPKQN
ncbi:MAG: AsmA-like C-terminal region-containing protein [Verrucomicrobiota bacterium]